MTHKKKKKRDTSEDESNYEDCEELVEWGGELIFAVDFTSGGAPLGCTLEELRKSDEQDNYQAGWARAKRVFRRAFSNEDGSTNNIEIGRIRKAGEGLYRKAFYAWIDIYNQEHTSGT